MLRRWHTYLSVFVAPSLLFFALTGAVQTYRIPDQPGAPVWMQKLARVHKDDVFAVKPPRPRKPDGGDRAAAKGQGEAAAKPAPKASTAAAKAFFAIVSLVIAATAGIGMWMALGFGRERRVMWALTLAGALIPVMILAF